MSPLSILCVEITQNYFIWKKKKSNSAVEKWNIAWQFNNH